MILYDCTNYSNKSYRLEPVSLISASNIWNAQKGSWNYLIDTDFRDLKKRLAQIDDNRRLILDPETCDYELFPEFQGTKKDSWMLDVRDCNDWRMERQRGRLFKLILKVKELKPDNPVGVYGCCPIRDFWKSQNNDQDWIDANTFQKPIGYFSDFVSPSLYLFYETKLEQTKTFLTNTLEQAKRYNKPIIPFFRPRFHPSCTDNTDPDFWVPDYYMQECADIIKKYADGLILWDQTKPIHDFAEHSSWYEILSS